MLIFHKITMINFRSYKGVHEFEFPTEAGLYFFGGINLVDKIGGNAAGKSTFLEAIIWCMYGKTSRGLKGNEVISDWGTSHTTVELDLTIGERFIIKRTQHPNGLFFNEKPIDQIELQKHLRLNFDAYLHSILNAQFGESFFSLTPAAKLTLFSDINNLDFWIEKAEEANKQAKSLQDALVVSKQQEVSLNDQIGLISADIDMLLVNETDFLKKKTKEVTNLKQEIQEQEEFLRQYVTMASVKYGDYLTALRAYKDADSLKESCLSSLTNRRKGKEMYQIELENLKKEYLKFAELEKQGRCEHCTQQIANGVISRAKKSTEEMIKVKNEVIEKLSTTIQSSIKTLIAAKNKVESASLELDTSLKRFENANAKTKEIKENIKSLNSDLSKLKEEINPFTALIKAKHKKLNALDDELDKVLSDKNTFMAKEIAFSFWGKAFKRLRLFIIEQAFNSLEIEVNNSLVQLGLTDWQVTFDIERENKSGGITKGFVVFIKSPNNEQPVRWENWSGGETQRLQLAGDMGLSNLIMTQAGLSNTIEFYDEPSTHLSHEGMLDLAALLHERAFAEGKQIWIVDHTTITNFSKFKGIITATKDSNGSSIKYEPN